MGRMVALLRAVNVGGTQAADGRAACALCAELGWEDVATYIQSGNVVFTRERTGRSAEAALEDLIRKHSATMRPLSCARRRNGRIIRPAIPFPTRRATGPISC